MQLSRFCAYISVTAAASLFLIIGFYRYRISNLKFSDWGLNQANDRFQYDYRPHNGSSVATNASHRNATHPETVLVLATLAQTDNSWVATELADLLGDQGNLYTAIYVADDIDATLHTPKNKGHEAMAYLSYLIDYYDSLPEVSIMMHGHSSAWHNNYLLDLSSSKTVRHLNRQKVLREGYMNLRAHWGPGCPEHLHPLTENFDVNKKEEVEMARAWKELFSPVPLPDNLAQPCCSQFAVSRDYVRRRPLSDYVHFRDWLLKSDLSDFLTGRIWEYLWQYVFTGETAHCPHPGVSYCDGFGVCFEDPDEYARFFEKVDELQLYQKELDAWEAWNNSKRDVAELQEPDAPEDQEESTQARRHEQELLQLVQASQLAERSNKRDAPVPGGPDASVEGPEARQAWLRQKIAEAWDDLTARKTAALQTGQDPMKREGALAAARNASVPIDLVKNGPVLWP